MSNIGIFAGGNPGNPADIAFFENNPDVTPITSEYILNGDLTIDNCNLYTNPIHIGNGGIFNGNGHTITLDTTIVAPSFPGLFSMSNGSTIRNLNVTTSGNLLLRLAANRGWIVSRDAPGSGSALIDNCSIVGILRNSGSGGICGVGAGNGGTLTITPPLR